MGGSLLYLIVIVCDRPQCPQRCLLRVGNPRHICNVHAFVRAIDPQGLQTFSRLYVKGLADQFQEFATTVVFEIFHRISVGFGNLFVGLVLPRPGKNDLLNIAQVFA
jgi:hypothetical protein